RIVVPGRISGRRQRSPRKDQKNSPSRFRFHPPLQPAFGFRLRSPGVASSYSRSVLGASGTLEEVNRPCKRLVSLIGAICEKFCFPQFPQALNLPVDKPVGSVMTRGLM